jgi:lipoate-protein ligase A
MNMPWRLLPTDPARGNWNMAVDEAILECVGKGISPPTLRLYAWEPACLSLGHAQPVADVDISRLKERGWDLVRRPTGGRAVLHTDEITYAVIAHKTDPHVAGTVLESYHHLSEALVAALRLLGLQVEVQAHVGKTSQIPNPVCFEVPSAYEITFSGKKLVGSAQARRKEGVLQHGSLPLTGDLLRILQVLTFPDENSRLRDAADLQARATTLEAALGRTVTWHEAAQALTSAFRTTLSLDLRPGDLSTIEKQRIEEIMTAREIKTEGDRKKRE